MLSPETCRVKPLRRINAIVASCWIYFTTPHALLRVVVPVVPNFCSLNVIFVLSFITSPPRNLRDIFCVQCRCPCKTAERASVTRIVFIGLLIYLETKIVDYIVRN